VLPESVHALIRQALEEDIGSGDHTTLSCIPATARGAARLLVKQDGVLAGVEVAEAVMDAVDERLHRRVLLSDGARVNAGDVAFTVTGPARAILMAERVLLNFMQRMSGIATLTRAYVEAIEGTGCRVLDTRKTTPCLRVLEKMAVRLGGGHNHRHGLYDMVMIKDNHVDLAGGIPQAIQAANIYLKEHGLILPIEIETRGLRELEEVLAHGGVQRIMFDNYSVEDMRIAVKRVNGRFETEASGGINLATARAFASTGVDFLSVGALTHSAPALDISLKAM
jgi:nicotinate-nucleotide pyrophosphorylase (carboxylating)